MKNSQPRLNAGMLLFSYSGAIFATSNGHRIWTILPIIMMFTFLDSADQDLQFGISYDPVGWKMKNSQPVGVFGQFWGFWPPHPHVLFGIFFIFNQKFSNKKLLIYHIEMLGHGMVQKKWKNHVRVKITWHCYYSIASH